MSLRLLKPDEQDTNPDTRLNELLYDAGRLVCAFYDVLEEAPDNVYSAALPFVPRKARLREQYSQFLIGKATVLAGTDDTWGACLHTMQFSKRSVSSVTYSPDSKLILYAFWDGTVEIQDAATGALHRRHNGSAVPYDGSIRLPDLPRNIALACSPSGTYVLSVLRTGILHRWDITSSTMSTSFVINSVDAPREEFFPYLDPHYYIVRDVNFIFSPPDSGGDIVIFLSPTGKLNVFEFSIDGSRLVSMDPSVIPAELRDCSFISLSTCDGIVLLYTTGSLWTWNVLRRDGPKSIPLPQADDLASQEYSLDSDDSNDQDSEYSFSEGIEELKRPLRP